MASSPLGVEVAEEVIPATLPLGDLLSALDLRDTCCMELAVVVAAPLLLLPAGVVAVVVVVATVAGVCWMMRGVCAFTTRLETRGVGDTGMRKSPSASEDELCGRRCCLCWALSSGDAIIVHTCDALMNESMGTS